MPISDGSRSLPFPLSALLLELLAFIDNPALFQVELKDDDVRGTRDLLFQREGWFG